MWRFGLHASARVTFCTRLSSRYRQGRYYSSGRNEGSTTKLRWKIFSTAKNTLAALLGLKFFFSEAIQHRGVINALLDSTIFHLVGPKIIKPKLNFQRHKIQIYQPLTAKDETRLLVLEPGQNTDQISCGLINVSLTWRARYEALSYTWGDPKTTKSVMCSGKNIDVTTNLHSALHHLRYPDRQRILWVDALCIDQEDDKDKETQVQRMGQIYSRARRVLIWLGEDVEDTRGAIGSIKQLDFYFKALYRKRRITNLLPAFGTWTAVFSDALPTSKVPTDFEWGPVLRLLERPWFLRTWIIQEAVLGRRAIVISGTDAVDWKTFERVCQGIGIYQTSTATIPEYGKYKMNEAVKTLMIAREERNAIFLKRWFSRKEFTKMMDLLNESLDFQCSDKRDKVFGLLGIATDTGSDDEGIRPDYESSVEEVYRRFVVWEIKKNHSLRSLSCASDRSKSVYLLPSWVPDFSQLQNTTNLMRFEKRVNFNATKKSKPQARFSDQGDVLYLGGQAVDSIHLVGETEYTDLLSSDVLESHSPHAWQRNSGWLRECIAIASQAEKAQAPLIERPNRVSEPIFGLTKERYEEFWRTLTCSHDTGMTPGPAIHGIWTKSFIELIFQHANGDDGPTTTTTHQDGKVQQERLLHSQHIHAIIALMNKHRSFCSTTAGRIGLVPRAAKAGDVICVLYGGRVPYVLRPGRKDDGYGLLGECYIHGLMDGEAMDMESLFEGEAAPREFGLC